MKIVAHEDTTGFAPRDCRWQAVDDDTYDGAEDNPHRGMIGFGRTEAEAIADLERLLEEVAYYSPPPVG
jgi:hypothetical protein